MGICVRDRREERTLGERDIDPAGNSGRDVYNIIIVTVISRTTLKLKMYVL